MEYLINEMDYKKIKFEILLGMFENLMNELNYKTKENSCKYDGCKIHHKRFNYIFYDDLDTVFRKTFLFLSKLNIFSDEKIDFHKSIENIGNLEDCELIMIAVGVDIRERIEDSRFKIWFEFGKTNSQFYEFWENSPYDEEWADFIKNTSSMIGIDYYLNGLYSYKPHIYFKPADLTELQCASLERWYGKRIVDAMKSSCLVYIANKNRRGGNSVYFFSDNILGIAENMGILNGILKDALAKNDKAYIICVEHKEVINGRVNHFNLYYK